MAAVMPALAQDNLDTGLAFGIAQRNAGQIDAAIDTFENLDTSANSALVRDQAAGELGATLLLAHRFAEAEILLNRAFAELSDSTGRMRYAVDLGNLALVQHHPEIAKRWYQMAAASLNPSIRISAELDLARVTDATSRLAALRAISQTIESVEPVRLRSLYRVNLAYQAESLGLSGQELAYRNASVAMSQSKNAGEFASAAQAGDALAQIYEDQHRNEEALELNQRALALAQAAPATAAGETTVALDWREARLMKAQGRTDNAIAAFERAADQIRQIRPDLPIEYQDGSSSFAATLKPIYLGLVDLRLQRTRHLSKAGQAEELKEVIDDLEMLKQAEMQDFLGDRCTVDAIRQGGPQPGPGVAFIYPVLLPDRLELIVETSLGINQITVAAPASEVDAAVRHLATNLRNDAPSGAASASQLYDWLIRPLDSQLQQQSIKTLVFVSDGVLRLVPIGALYDGQQYLVERYASATVTGLSITNASVAESGKPSALIAGMSTAGPVVDQLDAALRRVTTPAATTSEPDVSARELPTPSSPATSADRAAERASLALPGVRDEVAAIQSTLHGTLLLDQQFTDARFRDEASSGDYRIVHIASHGFFGGSASDSFILTYDKVLTIDELQQLLESEHYRAHPIEILSLSACETAEGNERSPLGISGAAMKARAKSVIGTLWPVDDRAAQVTMTAFYAGIEGQNVSKAEALRDAQLKLLRDPATARPFYWAPFVLIGNWL